MPAYDFRCTDPECDHVTTLTMSMKEYMDTFINQNKEDTECEECGCVAKRIHVPVSSKWGSHKDAKFLGKHIDDTPFGRN
jgi:transcription initiation factor TFIIIB Brf1 subunit/transcription initiation factor TFIIB